MPTLDPGSPFPRVNLREQSGGPATLPPGEVLYAFFKTTCPTTEMTWPHLERIRRLAEGGGMRVQPVSQDGPEETAEFHRRTGFSADALYDPEPWEASAALGLVSVPAFFLVGADGVIRETAIGFQRQKMEAFAARAAQLGGRSVAALFSPGESIPQVRPG